MRLLKDNGVFLFELPNEDDELINLVPEYSKIVHFQDPCNLSYKSLCNYFLLLGIQ